jgi:hypothetical protein
MHNQRAQLSEACKTKNKPAATAVYIKYFMETMGVRPRHESTMQKERNVPAICPHDSSRHSLFADTTITPNITQQKHH